MSPLPTCQRPVSLTSDLNPFRSGKAVMGKTPAPPSFPNPSFY